MVNEYECTVVSDGSLSLRVGSWHITVVITSQGVSEINFLEWPANSTLNVRNSDSEPSGIPLLVPDGNEMGSPLEFRKLVETKISGYLSGMVPHCPLPVDLTGATTFQRRVYQAAQMIPYGSQATYGWVASKIGQASSYRAVGQALGCNPVPVLVPCHRVVARDGLGGFSGGLDLKRALLRLEGWKEDLDR